MVVDGNETTELYAPFIQDAAPIAVFAEVGRSGDGALAVALNGAAAGSAVFAKVFGSGEGALTVA